MYIIINKTDNTLLSYKGNYPGCSVEDMLADNKDIIILSLYSNTIKVPIINPNAEEDDDTQWKEYPLPLEHLAHFYNTNK